MRHLRRRRRRGFVGLAGLAVVGVLAALVPESTAAASTPKAHAVAPAAVVLPHDAAGDTDGTFVPITPARMLDTRPGGHTVDGFDAGIGAVQGADRIAIINRAGIPASAKAVVLNVTVTGATAPTYVTVYPGPSLPPTSTVNATPGSTVAVASTVTLNPGDVAGEQPGSVSVFNKAGAIQVIIDVTGYYLGAGVTPGSVLHAQTPVRVLDTRTSGHAAILGHHFVAVGLTNTGTTAVALNVTVTGAASAGYVTVWPGGAAGPLATSSNLNFRAGQTVANMAVVGTQLVAGKPTFSVGNGGSGPVHVIVDVVGWYSSSPSFASGGLRFHAIAPLRLVDTRVPTGAHPLAAGAVIAIATSAKVGDGLTQALVANLTGLGDTSATYLAAFPGPTWPGTSSLNLAPRQTASNMIMTGMALPARTFDLKNGAGTAQAIIDVNGYFEAAPPVSVTLTADVTSAAAEQPVTFTASVAATGGGTIPAGRVVLVDGTGGATLASRPLAGLPVQVVTAALSPGAHQMVAQFVATAPGSAPVTSTAVAVTVAAPAASAAVTFQGDADHTGIATGSTLTSSLHTAWTVDLGGGITYPLIVGGRVFAVGTDTSDTARLSALDAATGAVDWGPVVVGPHGSANGVAQLAYDGGTVFAVTRNGYVAAYSATTGTVLWSAQVTLANGAGAWPPVAYDGALYVSVPGALYVLTEDSGFQVWSVAPIPNQSGASPDVDASGVYVGYACPKFNGYTLGGAPRWTGGDANACPGEAETASVRMGEAWVSGTQDDVIELASGIASVIPYTFERIPTVDSQSIYLMSGGVITSRGANDWTFSGDGALESTPVATGSPLFVHSWKGTLYALDRVTGAVVWSGAAGVNEGASTWLTGFQGLSDGMAVAGSTLVLVIHTATGSGLALAAYTSS